MADKKNKTSLPTPGLDFTYAGKGQIETPAQMRVTQECKHPVTPYKINDEDWKYGIGLN
ncbi:MAG: hypothetical protein ACXW30_06705 [Micavibrio sp.]